MLFRIIWVGKTRNTHLRALSEDYFSRLSRFVRCEIVEIRESAAASAREGIEDEGSRIISALKPDALTVLLDVDGETNNSHDIGEAVRKWQNQGVRQVEFIIGGHHGHAETLRRKARTTWSLSRLTFTHEMARVLLLEQLYRAYTIIGGLPYQK